MNLVIDSGNTRVKAATFTGTRLEDKFIFSATSELKIFLNQHQFDGVMVSTVNLDGNEVLRWVNAEKKYLLSHRLPLPIQIHYETPETLGSDRIAAACGMQSIFPERDSLAIDAGTCITYDFVDRFKNYKGGAISPGIDMRFEALHTFTKKLPLVLRSEKMELTGTSTEESILSGVLNGIVAEMEGIIGKYRHSYPSLGVVLCGGDSLFFENKLKPTIFAAPDLVLTGLNRILLHNAAF